MIDEIKKHKWVNYGRWIQPPLSGAFWCHWNKAESLKKLFGKNKFEHALFLDGHTIFKKSDQQFLQKYIDQLIKSNSISFFRLRLEHLTAQYKENHLSILYSNISDQKEYLRKLFHTYQEIIGLWTIIVIFGDELQGYILKNRIVSSEDELLKKVDQIPQIKKTWLEAQDEEIGIFAQYSKGKKILLKKKDPLTDAIKDHVAFYRWFGTHHWMGPEYSKKTCIQHIEERSLNKNIIPLHKKDELIKILHSFRFWRTHCAEVTARVVFESRQYLKSYAKPFGLSYNDIIYFTNTEITSSFTNKRASTSINKDIVKKRIKGYGCFVDKKGHEHVIIEKELADALNVVIKSNTVKKKELKGNVASIGPRVKGKVRILLEPKDFSKFKKGDILVAPETTPDFVPCMKIARAIITDRGGVTSHAAIVSRELGIPCITGTGNATTTLNNGTMIEIDTKNNIITII